MYQVKKNFINKNKLNSIKNELFKIGVNVEYLEIRNKNNLTKNINRNSWKFASENCFYFGLLKLENDRYYTKSTN